MRARKPLRLINISILVLICISHNKLLAYNYGRDSSFISKIYFKKKLIYDSGRILDSKLRIVKHLYHIDSHEFKLDTFYCCYKGIEFKEVLVRGSNGVIIHIYKDKWYRRVHREYRVGTKYLGTSVSGVSWVKRKKRRCD